MARTIACGHCGGTHSSVAEVRACSTRERSDHQIDLAEPAPPTAASAGRGVQARPTRSPDGRGGEELAGPSALGRSLLVRPGARAPEPWSDAPVIEASAGAPPDTVDRLHEAWRARERVVIVWTGELPEAAPLLRVPFFELDPGTELPGERLRFAVTANTVNLLEASPRFEPLDRAVELGAAASGPGDVLLDSGTPVWVDGGPMDPLTGVDLAGLAVVPRPHLVAGRLLAVTSDPPQPSAELAADQLAAVGHRGGPARIIAPAGSGKTRVLTERTRHLVNDRGLHPAAVSLVAYNRRARQEMAERLADVAGLDIRTLNSLALAIATGGGPFASPAGRPGVQTSAAGRPGLQTRAAGGPGLQTINEIDARRVLERLVPGRRRRALTDPLEPWIDALSACRLGLRDPDEVEAAYGADIAGFAGVLEQYRTALRDRGQLDYDEQILTAVEVLLTDAGARAAARRATPVLLVDEFQDLTPAHLLLIRLLAGPAGEVFAVGDDDQTIYGYSGASPDWLVGFARFFPGAGDHALTVNYRCPAPVVEAATRLLSHNRNRVTKTIQPAPGTGSNGSGLDVNAELDPQRALVAHVDRLIEAGASPSEVAVLARVNAALIPAAIYLTVAGHPVALPPGVGSHLLDRSGTGAALAWLRLASSPEQRLGAEDLRLALRRPPRSLHPRIADWVCEQRSVKDLLALSNRLNREREADTVAALAADIERLQQGAQRGLGAAQLLDVVYHDIGLLGAASQLDQSQRTARRPAHADELAALRAAAEIGPGPTELEAWMRGLLDRLPRSGDGNRRDLVTLATIHSTKGLEWPHVVIHDVRGDLYPHSLADDVEEERRIFHVALTRGRTSVLVNAVPPAAGAPVSPFVAELELARPPWDVSPPPAGRRSGAAAGDGDPGRRQGSSMGGNGSGPKPARAEPASETEAALRAALAEWRTARCRAEGVPAYIVLGNATLDAIAAAAPTSLAALGRIKGIGPAKLERYGADILGIVVGQS